MLEAVRGTQKGARLLHESRVEDLKVNQRAVLAHGTPENSESVSGGIEISMQVDFLRVRARSWFSGQQPRPHDLEI